LQQAKQNFRVQLFITILSIILFSVKMAAYYFTYSLVVLSDALESIVNMVAGCIGLFALYVAAKPKDVNHPYGHGKAEFVSAAIEGTLIIASGLLIIYQTIVSLFYPIQLNSLDKGLWLIAATAIINFIAGTICLQIGKKNNSIALKATGKHLYTDTLSTIVVIAGLLIMLYSKMYWLDKVLAFAISFIILYNGYKIIRTSMAGIMDEADMELLKQIIKVLNENRRENWIDLHNFRVIKYGRLLHIDCHLTIPWYLNIHQAHEEVDLLTNLIKEKFGGGIELFVHTDGCLNFSCSICLKQNCIERKRPFLHKIEWTLENVLSNQKHNSVI